MNNSSSQETKNSTTQRETYALRGRSTSTKWFARRTAARDAAFFLPHLRSGMRLLDCGCGTAFITVGLAETVAPGQVVALDNDADTIRSAETYAEEHGVSNIRFETADVYTIPFPSDSFDAVFSHALLEHLREPVEVLKEMHRVLKPGGLVGVRCIDLDGVIFAPEDPLLEQVHQLIDNVIRLNGGNFKVGKHLRALLNDAGFARVEASASYDSYGTPEATALWAERVVGERDSKDHRWVRSGLVDLETRVRMEDAWRKWGENPDAFYAKPWFEAVGWKQ